MNIAAKVLLGGAIISYSLNKEEEPQCFIYRDDIGAFWGIKGYEEQVSEVGTHKGHISWPQFRFFATYDSGSLRRGNNIIIYSHPGCFRRPVREAFLNFC